GREVEVASDVGPEQAGPGLGDLAARLLDAREGGLDLLRRDVGAEGHANDVVDHLGLQGGGVQGGGGRTGSAGGPARAAGCGDGEGEDDGDGSQRRAAEERGREADLAVGTGGTDGEAG